jgi:hypothetical protein
MSRRVAQVTIETRTRVFFGRYAQPSALRRYLDNVMHAAGRAKMLVDRILGSH